MHDIPSRALTARSVKTEWFTLTEPSLRADVHVSRFGPPGGAEEIHLQITPRAYGAAEDQLRAISQAYEIAKAELGLDSGSAVFRRIYCSDVVNQAEALDCHPLTARHRKADPCAVSWVGQAAVPDSKLALWAYHLGDDTGGLVKEQDGSSLRLQRGS